MIKEDRLKFKKLFGIDCAALSQRLIISPFFSPKLFGLKLKNSKYFKGLIYKGVTGTYQGQTITFINTGIGPMLVADSILAQDQDNVCSVIFIGAVGGVTSLSIADIVLIKQAYFDAGYYQRLAINFKNYSSVNNLKPDNKLMQLCSDFLSKQKIKAKEINVISLNSLWHQDDNLIQQIKKKGIQAVDLECAFFYAMAKKQKIKALALCYVSDLLLTKPYWHDLSCIDRIQVQKSISYLIEVALELSILVKS